MAVVAGTRPGVPGDHTEGTPGRVNPPASKGPGDWVKKHKAVAALGGAGIAVLVLSHKGSSGAAAPGSNVATDAAAEQAAIDQAVGDATGLNPGNASTGSDGASGGGDGSTGAGGSNAGGGDGSDPSGSGTGGDPSGTGGLTINVNEPGPATAAAAAAVSPHGKAPASIKPAAKAGVLGIGAGATGSGANSVAKQKVSTGLAGAGAATKTPTQKAKQAPKAPAKPTKPKQKTKGSVIKFGRAFSGAIGVHVGMSHTTSDGCLHTPVTVNFPGYSETHMAHNNGEAGWTDNVPGYTPPSRNVPQVRLPTPALAGADWNESDA